MKLSKNKIVLRKMARSRRLRFQQSFKKDDTNKITRGEMRYITIGAIICGAALGIVHSL